MESAGLYGIMQLRDYIRSIIRPDYRNDASLLDQLEMAYYDSRFFAKVFLAESFEDPITSQHDEVWKLIDDDRLQKVCVCAWRGFGKSAISKARCVKNLVFRRRKFIMYVGETHDHAVQETQNIKMFLMSERIKDVFGILKPKAFNGVDLEFSKTTWHTQCPWTGKHLGVVMPRGAGQQVRGWNFNIDGKLARPDEIQIDDLEDQDEIENEEIRKRIRKWFNGSLLKCVDTKRSRDDATGLARWRIFYQDTMKHHDANIVHVMQSSDWKSVVFPKARKATEAEIESGLAAKEGPKSYVSCVPEIVSHDEVQREVAVHMNDSLMEEYSKEMLCIPTPPDDACVSRNMFQYYKDKESGIQNNPNVIRFIIMDPAKTSNPRSAFTAITAVGFDPFSHRIYIRDSINRKMTGKEMIEALFDMMVACNTRIVGVETSGLEEMIQQPLTSFARERRMPVQWVWLRAMSAPKTGDYGHGKDGVKRARFSTMIPFYEKLQVYHEEVLRNSAIENQILSFPHCARWDALDTVGYIPQMLDRGNLTYIPQVDIQKPLFYDIDSDYDRWTEGIQKREWALV